MCYYCMFNKVQKKKEEKKFSLTFLNQRAILKKWEGILQGKVHMEVSQW